MCNNKLHLQCVDRHKEREREQENERAGARELASVKELVEVQVITVEREGERSHSNYHKYTAKSSTAAYINVVVVVVVFGCCYC